MQMPVLGLPADARFMSLGEGDLALPCLGEQAPAELFSLGDFLCDGTRDLYSLGRLELGI